MRYSEKNTPVDKTKFQMVQKDQKIYDKKFETKPIGYFKDAMIRFSKNRTNVIATIILFTMITLSIFIPVLTTKNYEVLESQLRHLPPRVPILENFGIFDGVRYVENQEVDITTIDPETGLGVPPRSLYRPEFIEMDSLINYNVACSTRIESCRGGVVSFTLRDESLGATFQSPERLTIVSSQEPKLVINVTEFSDHNGVSLDIKVDPAFTGNYETLISITEPGVYELDMANLLNNPSFVSSFLRFELTALEPRASVTIDSFKFYTNLQEEPVMDDFGYALSIYERVDGSARTPSRSGAELLMSSFRYDVYESALGEVERRNMASTEYYGIIEEFEDVCTKIDNPDNPNGWFFTEGCPIMEVKNTSEPVVVGGIAYYSYHLVINYALYAGYDDIPYFFFGTTEAGHDLFALTWVALRTSLLIGLAAATINITIGIVYGAISGYYGGKVDLLMERFSEVIARIPFLVILAIAVAYVGPGITTLIIVLIVSGWIGVASVTRTQFYRYKGREYVLASRTLGAKDSRLIFRHILPNGIGTIVTASVLMIPLVIFTESTLSYLGFGIGYGQSFNVFGVEFSGVSIGVLLATGRTELLDKPYLTYFPAIIISILMITFNMFGNALRDAFNPSLRGSE